MVLVDLFFVQIIHLYAVKEITKNNQITISIVRWSPLAAERKMERQRRGGRKGKSNGEKERESEREKAKKGER